MRHGSRIEAGPSRVPLQCLSGGPNKEIAENLAGFANSFAYEVRERILELVKANLGVRQQKNLMLVLRKTGEWVDAERAELQRAPERFSGLRIVTPETAHRLRDLDEFDKFLRVLAKDILRAMADYNFRKRVSKSDG